MSEVTHGHCPKCDSVEPIIWINFHQENVFPEGEIDCFTGMEAKCRSCGFVVAKLGSVSKKTWRGVA